MSIYFYKEKYQFSPMVFLSDSWEGEILNCQKKTIQLYITIGNNWYICILNLT